MLFSRNAASIAKLRSLLTENRRSIRLHANPKFEVERAIAKTHKQGAWRRCAAIGDDFGMFARNRLQDIADLLYIRSVRDTHCDEEATMGVPQNPVCYAPRDEFGIRHENVLIVERFDLRRANSHTANKTPECRRR